MTNRIKFAIPSSLTEWEEYGFDKSKPLSVNKCVFENVLSHATVPRKMK